MSDQFLTAAQVSDRYGGRIKVATLDSWRSSGKGPAFTKLGSVVVYPLNKLIEWEASNTVTPEDKKQ